MKLVTIVVAMIVALGTASAVSAQGRGKAAKAQTRAVKAETRTAKNTAKAETRVAKTQTKAIKAENKAARTNPQQEARLLARLPAGTNIHDASQGFKNRGQFVAAVNASNNHNIPFADLKAKMTGIAPGSTVPTTAPMSLGQAMKSFKVAPTTPLP